MHLFFVYWLVVRLPFLSRLPLKLIQSSHPLLSLLCKCEQLHQFSRSLSQDITEFGIGYTLRDIGKISYGSTLVPMGGVVDRTYEGGKHRSWNGNISVVSIGGYQVHYGQLHRACGHAVHNMFTRTCQIHQVDLSQYDIIHGWS